MGIFTVVLVIALYIYTDNKINKLEEELQELKNSVEDLKEFTGLGQF